MKNKSEEQDLNSILLCNIKFSNFSSQRDYIDVLRDRVKSNIPSSTCFVNAHMIVESNRDSAILNCVNSSHFICLDGMPLVWAARWMNPQKPVRIAGMDLFPQVLSMASENEWNVFFVGGSNEMMERARVLVKTKFSGIQDFNFISTPFGEISEELTDEIVKEINRKNPHFVFVVLSCPKQEKWMSKISGRVNASILAIGGALPVLIGDQKRAPVWMQKFGLEWFYRFIQEPRRLFRRYLVTNTIFLYLVLKDFLARKFF